MLLEITIKALQQKLNEFGLMFGEIYRRCEDCDCRRNGCNCPVQSYLDEVKAEYSNE